MLAARSLSRSFQKFFISLAMHPAEPGRPVSYVPCRFASGTFPVSRSYHLRQMLYNYDRVQGRVDTKSTDHVLPSFPFSDVPVFADTVDIETLAFHDFWGCLVTPDNVAARVSTDDLRYHAWVAAKRVVESRPVDLKDKKALLRVAMIQFMVELGLVLLDLFPGPLVIPVDPRLQDDPEGMVSSALAMVAKFDGAHVRRWRIIVTLPATEEGILAARELTHRHGILTHLSLVSCLAHASACISAGACLVSMSVEPIMEWFEQRGGARDVSQNHPGIEAIQSCATYIDRRKLNTTLLATDVRKWSELKQLGGIGATALGKEQLDEIPMRRMVTWYPQDDASPATRLALEAPYPPDASKGLSLLTSLPAECRSLVFAVMYVRLHKMALCMDAIEQVVWDEVKQRIRLETVPLERLYRRPIASLAGAQSRTATSRSRSRSRARHDARQERAPNAPMVEGVDYF